PSGKICGRLPNVVIARASASSPCPKSVSSNSSPTQPARWVRRWRRVTVAATRSSARRRSIRTNRFVKVELAAVDQADHGRGHTGLGDGGGHEDGLGIDRQRVFNAGDAEAMYDFFARSEKTKGEPGRLGSLHHRIYELGKLGYELRWSFAS